MNKKIWLAGLAFAVFAGEGDAAEPFMMMRFRGPQTDGGPVWSATAAQLVKYRAACDEVWFSTGIGLPPMAWHVAQSRRQAAAADELRRAGILPGLQFQATLGHGDDISSLEDCSAKDWGGFTGPSGVACRNCSCPREPAFLNYVAEMARLYAAWKPSTVWIDDDLRIDNHLPATRGAPFGGCFCERCVAAFSALEAAPYERLSLVAALGTDAALRKRWEKFSFQSLARVAHTIAEAVHEVSPETRMGYQHALREDGLQKIVYEALAAASGKPVRSRPGGGAYYDHDPYQQIDKALLLARQMKSLADCPAVADFCPEVETCPRTFACRTGRSLVAESFANLALGMTALSYLIVDAAYETPEWYGRTLFAPLAEEAVRLRAYEEENRGTVAGGFAFPAGQPPRHLVCSAFPLVTGPADGTCGTILTAAIAETLPDAELERVFAGGVVLDGEAVQALAHRGKAELLAGLKARTAPPALREIFTDDALNAGLVCRRGTGYPCFTLKGESAEVRPLGYYVNARKADCGISALCGVSPRGGRFAVLGCGGFNLGDAAGDQLRRLHRMADFVSRGRAPVVCDDPLRAFVVPRVTTNGILRTVMVLNVTIDDSAPVRVRLRGVPPAVTGEWVGPGNRVSPITLRREGDEVFAVLPALEPWKVGWLRFTPAKDMAVSVPAVPATEASGVETKPWRPANGAVPTAVALRGDVVYVACGERGVVAAEITPDGFEEIGEVSGLSLPVQALAIADGKLYCADATGATVYTFLGNTVVERTGHVPVLPAPPAEWRHNGKRLRLTPQGLSYLP